MTSLPILFVRFLCFFIEPIAEVTHIFYYLSKKITYMNLKIVTIIVSIFMAYNVYAMTSHSENSSAFHHFTWGADIGSTIDIAGNDMSSIDIDAYFGYKNNFFRTIGVGAGIKSAIGNSYTFIPVYAILRTNFTNKPTLCFMDMKLGYSFNTLKEDVTQNSFMGAIGLGFNLYSGREFKSHLILSYTFMNIDSYYTGEIYNKMNNFSGMSVKIGISF